MNNQELMHVLLVDDDPDDCEMALEVISEMDCVWKTHVVRDGEEMLDYLHRRNFYRDKLSVRIPDLIILDLNMPRKDGRTALAELKQDERLHNIPVVVFTTSDGEEDVFGSYALGASSFIVKPHSYEGMRQVLESLAFYWGQTVKLPPKQDPAVMHWPKDAMHPRKSLAVSY